MKTQLLLNEDLLNKLIIGVDKLANTVKVTLDPRGRNVTFDQKFDVPLVVNDGVTIAKQIEFEDPNENIGASLIKQAAIKTNETVGDGTITSIVLAQYLISEGIKNLTSGANPIEMKKGIEKTTNTVIQVLTDAAVDVKDQKTIQYIATINRRCHPCRLFRY